MLFIKTLRLKRLSPQVPVVVRRNRLVLTGGAMDMPKRVEVEAPAHHL
jgi:hypothetical protein